MQIINSLRQLPDENHYAVTIGNFDGVHLGHQQVLSFVKKHCQENGLKLVVLSFNPHPQEILNPGNYFLLNSVEEKRELLGENGVDFLCEIKFDRNFSTLSPEQFLNEHIFINMNLKKLFLGHDFAFGANKSGGHQVAEQLCEKNQVKVETLAKFEFENKRVSSSLVRKKILDGLVADAEEMLGRQFFISGQVIKGDGRGRKIGFPTANVMFAKNRVIPKLGVYITKTKIGKMTYQSVTNIGRKPTFIEDGAVTVESHILDFDRDIYGEKIQVSFVEHLRDEAKFNSVNDLIQQINKDVDKTREYFAKA